MPRPGLDRLSRVGLGRHPARGRACALVALRLPPQDGEAPRIQRIPGWTPLAGIAACPPGVAPTGTAAAWTALSRTIGIGAARIAPGGAVRIRAARVAPAWVDAARVASWGAVGTGVARIASAGRIAATRVASVPAALAGLTPRRPRIASNPPRVICRSPRIACRSPRIACRSPRIGGRRQARVAARASGPPGIPCTTGQRPGIVAARPGPRVIVRSAGAVLEPWWVRHMCFGC